MTTIEFQLAEWVKGNPIHNDERDECCPDFSCCEPELLAPKKTREAFQRADENGRMSMLMGFLGASLSHIGIDKDVYLVGDTPKTVQ